jgi:hypothetical protein
MRSVQPSVANTVSVTVNIYSLALNPNQVLGTFCLITMPPIRDMSLILVSLNTVERLRTVDCRRCDLSCNCGKSQLG